MRQVEVERKNFSPEFCSYPTRARKFQKNSKKNPKIKKSLSGIILSQNGRRQADKERKKILVPNSVHTWPGEENSEKKQQKNSTNQKTSFWHYFQPKRDEIGREKEKKNLVPNSVHTQPGQENSEKNCKKIKKPVSGIIFSQNGMRLIEKE